MRTRNVYAHEWANQHSPKVYGLSHGNSLVSKGFWQDALSIRGLPGSKVPMGRALKTKVLMRIGIEGRSCNRLHEEVPSASLDVESIFEEMMLTNERPRKTRAVLTRDEEGGVVVQEDVGCR